MSYPSTAGPEMTRMDFSYGSIYWSRSLSHGNTLLKMSEKPFWTMDFALSEKIQVDGCELDAGSWSVKRNYSPIKKITNLKERAQFLSVVFLENHFMDSNPEQIERQGVLSLSMMRCILHMLYKSFNPILSIIWMDSYVNQLAYLLTKKNPIKSPFHFSELEIIFKIMESVEIIENIPVPTTKELIQWANLPTHRFQKGCLEIYGLYPQTIIQLLKMKKALKEILLRKKSPSIISEELGFKHFGNFVTCFRKYFGLTPEMAATF